MPQTPPSSYAGEAIGVFLWRSAVSGLAMFGIVWLLVALPGSVNTWALPNFGIVVMLFFIGTIFFLGSPIFILSMRYKREDKWEFDDPNGCLWASAIATGFYSLSLIAPFSSFASGGGSGLY